MIVAGGLSGGLGSYVTGGSFWEGVRQGVISSSLNHALHGTFEAGQDPPEKGDRRMPQRGYGFEEVYNGTSWVADWNGKFYHASGQVTSTGSPFELLLGSGIASSTVKVLTAAKTSTNAFKHSFKYADRVRMRAVQDPVSHNFPYSFDDAILSTSPILKNNGYKIFQQAGTMNGKNGVFEIGLTKGGIIDHRFFRPIK
jgi:hypothetical protein